MVNLAEIDALVVDMTKAKISSGIHHDNLDVNHERMEIFTPLRVGWPPTPQVYFGP